MSEIHKPTPIETHSQILAGFLGAIDALFWPARNPSNAIAIGLKNRREQYRDGGLDWPGVMYQQRSELARAGLVSIVGQGIQLTDDAEHAMRRLIGLSSIGDLMADVTLTRLNDIESFAPADLRPGGWVAETAILAKSYADCPNASDWDSATEWVLPLLTSGVIESASSEVGHIFYRTTGLSRKALPGTPPHQINDGLRVTYTDSFFASIEERQQFKETEEDYTPLPATAQPARQMVEP